MEDDSHLGFDAEEFAYIGLHDATMKIYADNDRNGDFKLAANLLTKAYIPALIRAWCHMILSLKHSPLALRYAETAVALLDVEVRDLLPPEAFPIAQFELAVKLQEYARGRGGEVAPVTSSLIPFPPGPAQGTPLALMEASRLLPSPATKQHGPVVPGRVKNYFQSGPQSQNEEVDYSLDQCIRRAMLLCGALHTTS